MPDPATCFLPVRRTSSRHSRTLHIQFPLRRMKGFDDEICRPKTTSDREVFDKMETLLHPPLPPLLPHSLSCMLSAMWTRPRRRSAASSRRTSGRSRSSPRPPTSSSSSSTACSSSSRRCGSRFVSEEMDLQNDIEIEQHVTQTATL